MPTLEHLPILTSSVSPGASVLLNGPCVAPVDTVLHCGVDGIAALGSARVRHV